MQAPEIDTVVHIADSNRACYVGPIAFASELLDQKAIALNTRAVTTRDGHSTKSTHIHHAHSCTEIAWPLMSKLTVQNSDHVFISWPLTHVERTYLLTPTLSELGCRAAMRLAAADHLSKMHLHAALKCMASYLLTCILLTGQAAQLLFMTVWINLVMFATALQTTHLGPHLRKMQIPWLAQTTQCIAYLLWLLLTILRHFATNVHSIAAMCCAIMFAETQHTLNIHIIMLIFHITCAIIQVTPSIMLAVQQAIQLMMPPKTRGYKTFAHPKLRGGRYWRRIRYMQRRHRSQTLYRVFILLSCVLAKLYRFQLWKGLGTGSSTKPVRHTPHPDKKSRTPTEIMTINRKCTDRRSTKRAQRKAVLHLMS